MYLFLTLAAVAVCKFLARAISERANVGALLESMLFQFEQYITV